ncbi:MAG: hypothetical protein H3C28_02035 [Sphingomonadales bacterium]|nr:hypothetical protein [Sphingomonadales bacterium]
MRVRFPQHLDFQHPQFAVGDDQKVAAAAGGVEKFEIPQLFLKLQQVRNAAAVSPRLQPVEFRLQVIQEQWSDDLHDILFGGIVRALGAALLGIHHRLKKRAEDGGRDARPVEPAGVDQALAHAGVKGRDAQPIAE